MAVGQAWLQQLAGAPKTVDSSLIHLVIAYNAGEGRLIGWLAKDLQRRRRRSAAVRRERADRGDGRLRQEGAGAISGPTGRASGEPSPSLQALAENRWPAVPPAAEDEGKAVASAD